MNGIVISYVLLILKIGVKGDVEGPKPIDYCALKCDNEENVACDCTAKNDGRKEHWEEVEEFRKTMVEHHNELRNKLASGAEKSKGFPAAADMNVLNYDMNLEYLAMCHARKMKWEHDKCRKLQSGVMGGQNLAGSSDNAMHKKPYWNTTENWYNEINSILTNVTNERKLALVAKYGDSHDMVPSGETIGHFTQLIWAEITHVGCFRMSIPTNEDIAKNVIVCDYAGPKYGGNVNGLPMYQPGDPCTKCPNGTKCNGKYTSLCGDIILTSQDDGNTQGSVSDSDNANDAITTDADTFTATTTTTSNNDSDDGEDYDRIRILSSNCCVAFNGILLIIGFVIIHCLE